MDGLKHSLLRAVGTHSGTKVGEALIYDLGGNAAEQTIDGGVYGYSAVSFVDDRRKDTAKRPPATYIGFRLIKE